MEKNNRFSRIQKLRLLFGRKDKLQYSGLLVLMGIGALLEVVGIGAVPAFIATLAVPEKVRAYPAVNKILNSVGITTSTKLVIWGSVALILIFLVRSLYLIFLSYLQFRMVELHRVRIAHLLFSTYMYAPYEFHLKRNSAELLRNVDVETRQIVTGIINPLLYLVLNGLMTLFIVILLVATTPWSGLAAIGIVGGGSWLFLRLVRKRMHHYGQEARVERKKSIQAINQGLGGLDVAQILGVVNSLIEEYLGVITRFARYERFRNFVSKLSNPLLEFIAVAGLMFVVLSMVLTGMDIKNMVPMLGLFGTAIIRLRASVGVMTSNASQLGYNMASVDAVVDDLQLLKENRVKKVKSETQYDVDHVLPFHQTIKIDHVRYTYSGGVSPAVDDVSLTISQGESIGFVGATGSGKTTLVNLLLGLLKPQYGVITVDNVNIHDDLRGWQNNLGYIPQSIFLLDDTIKNNIAFGIPKDEINEDKLWEAIRAAQIEEFISTLPQGIDTYVGERGMRISGGQRQRIGLARSLYNNPDILIMDEATSSLDNQTESLVMRSLNELKGNRTMIMIAHRLSSVQKCDRLYFLKHGKIEAVGNFEELKEFHQEFKLMADAV